MPEIHCEKWEKIVFGVVVGVLSTMMVFNLLQLVMFYLAHPKATHSRVEEIQPYRYPWIVACPDQPLPEDMTNSEQLAAALMMPSEVATEPLATIAGWSEAEISTTKGSVDGNATMTKLAGPCNFLVECKLGDEVLDCCADAWITVTKLGACWVYNFPNKMSKNAKPIKGLQISAGKDFWLQPTTHDQFYLDGAIKVNLGSSVDLRLSVLRYRALGKPFGDKKYHWHDRKLFERNVKNQNELTHIKEGPLLQECGCGNDEFAVSCAIKERLQCMEIVFGKYENGTLPEPKKKEQNGDLHYKLTPTSFGESGDAAVAMTTIKYESPYQLLMEEYAVMTVASLVGLIGSSIATYMALFICFVLVVKLCKMCCCRGKGGDTFA